MLTVFTMCCSLLHPDFVQLQPRCCVMQQISARPTTKAHSRITNCRHRNRFPSVPSWNWPARGRLVSLDLASGSARSALKAR